MPDRTCSVCGCRLSARAQARRCRPCATEFRLAKNRQSRRDLGGRHASRESSARALADPAGWALHLESLAARAEVGLPLFARGGQPCR